MSLHAARATLALALALALPPLGFATPSRAADAPLEAPAAASADETPPNPTDEGRVWSEQVVVTATRSELAAGEAPVAVTVLDRAAIEAGPEYGLIDLVRRLPSLSVLRDGSTLIATPIDGGTAFRGLGGSAQARILLLVDGAPVNDPYANYLVWSRVPAEAIERIEVVPGNAGSWGNMALTGTIHLITRAASDRAFDAELKIGNYDTRAAALYYADSHDAWSGWASANGLDTGGYHVRAKAERDPLDEPQSKRFGNFNTKLDRTLSEQSAFGLGVTLFEERRRGGTPLTRSTSSEEALRLSWDRVTTGGASWQLLGYARAVGLQDDEPAPNAAGDAELPNLRLDAPSEALGGSATWLSAGRRRHTLRVGVDAQALSIDAKTYFDHDGEGFRQRRDGEGRQRVGGAFVQDTWRASERATVHLGARFDSIRTYDDRRESPTPATDEASLTDSSESMIHPSLGVAYAANARLRLRGGFYTGFRAASPSELFVNSVGRNLTLSNPGLEPERLSGVEAGLDFTPSPRAATRLTGYWIETSDLIERVELGRAGPDGGVVEPCGQLLPSARCRQRRNIGEVRSRGVELDQTLRLDERWRIHLTGAYVDARVAAHAADPSFVGNRVVRTPRTSATLELAFDEPRWFAVTGRLHYQGQRWNNIENTDLLGERLLFDLVLSRQISARWQVAAGVQNLFDERDIVNVTDRSEYGTPRLVQLTLRYRAR